MGERKKIVGQYEMKQAAPEFVALDAALQAAFDKHGEWYVREWLYSRLGRLQKMSRNRVPKKFASTPGASQ